MDRMYYLRKWYPLFPGLVRPVSGTFAREHYRWRAARRGVARTFVDTVVGILFKAWVPFRARQVARRHGEGEDWVRKASAIARERFADPNDIFLFRIHCADDLDSYIRRFEDAAFNKQINPPGWRADCVLADKIAFARRCMARGVRHPRLFATATGRRAGDRRIEIEALPDGTALLVKPARGEGGEGVRTLADAISGLRNEASFRRAIADLSLSRRHDWLLQERLSPHAALADLALDALPTVRMTTFLDEKGKGELVNAVFRFPSVPGIPIDNMKAGGILSSVELSKGILTIGCKGYGGGDVALHPVSGAGIPGRRLPDWSAARHMVERAHCEAFGEYRLIGWDVALTPDGPYILEGNAKPGVLMPQRSGRRGLGDQRYGELLAHHLRATRAD